MLKRTDKIQNVLQRVIFVLLFFMVIPAFSFLLFRIIHSVFNQFEIAGQWQWMQNFSIAIVSFVLAAAAVGWLGRLAIPKISELPVVFDIPPLDEDTDEKTYNLEYHTSSLKGDSANGDLSRRALERNPSTRENLKRLRAEMQNS